MATPLWTLDPETVGANCQACSHGPDSHVPISGPDGTAEYPCEAEERFDIDPATGRLTLVDEPCECENFEEGEEA